MIHDGIARRKMHTRRRRMKRNQRSAAAAARGEGNAASDEDEEFHFRLLSGEVAREKMARRTLTRHLTSNIQDKTDITSEAAASTSAKAPLLMETRSHSRQGQKQSNLYRLLSGRSRRRSFVWFNRLLALLIVVNVVCFVLESIPALGSDTSPYASYFYALEAFSSVVFLCEYVARVYTAPESRRNRIKRRHWSKNRARAQYMISFRAMIDLVSCLPFFVELPFSGEYALPTFTWLRMFRLFRILKSERSVRAFSSIYRVIWYNSEILGVALFIGFLLMMATSTFLWYLQPPQDSGDDFTSIPATFYLSILMLTGQGTPSGVLPWYTKIIVMLTAVFSVPIFVIPSSMLTWGFEAEAERLMRRKRERRRRIKV